MLFFFSLKSLVLPRDLHSFPTRRSSDLVIDAYHAACARITRTYDGFLAEFRGDGILAYFGYPFAPELGEEADRKSTRLNSSHGYISYAVFCLKKKKQTQ